MTQSIFATIFAITYVYKFYDSLRTNASYRLVPYAHQDDFYEAYEASTKKIRMNCCKVEMECMGKPINVGKFCSLWGWYKLFVFIGLFYALVTVLPEYAILIVIIAILQFCFNFLMSYYLSLLVMSDMLVYMIVSNMKSQERRGVQLTTENPLYRKELKIIRSLYDMVAKPDTHVDTKASPLIDLAATTAPLADLADEDDGGVFDDDDDGRV